ncbi:pyridoxamine 5'-phosphate oxidase family protein [Mumia zhuanghuii]|uniref:Pyridoxamine 5'-phosphate oxidase family protein n=2 Tax=Mumia TaxID=1546255 RepID=A0ABW1QI97_9ACTN|nr:MULTISPECIES: pyridoxamine 5'-phosphate oxidase family protein [Mumia]KAA1418262.1 pyridoxamine 5'-phosphate oxidase family protein [Mumia zhuanghuii]
MTEPLRATLLALDADADASPIPWEDIRRRFSEASGYWFATTSAAGRPHVRPVLAVWVDGAAHVASAPAAAKTAHLAADGRCSLTCQADDADLVVEGVAERVSGSGDVERVAAAYASKYGWAPAVHDGLLVGADGAPTAGPPPYEVYRIDLDRAYAFGTDGDLGPRSTRWQRE